ncbi:hypothetical protein ABFX02_02G123100 [Erythranthe guttata]
MCNALVLYGYNLETEPPSSSGIKESQAEEKVQLHKTVRFYKLFSFADFRDKILMTIGTIAAMGNGLSQPLMTFILGELIDVFAVVQTNGTVLQVSKVCLKFVYLALGCGAAAFLQVACWMITGQRQAARVRSLYLKTILRQEIAYFDQEVSTGEVIERMSSDTILIQDAIGEKVGNFVQMATSFLGGFVIAFLASYVSLVDIDHDDCFLSGGVMYVIRSKMAFQAEKAYTNAANVVQQTIGSIRTVASFTWGEASCV